MKITIQGNSLELNQLHDELINEYNTNNDVVLSKTSPVNTGILSRQPLGQFELLEFTITIIAGLATNTLYDYIKSKVTKIDNIKMINSEEEDTNNKSK